MSNSKLILLSFIICWVFINSSCKKSSTSVTIPPGNPNNEMTATVSINGSPATSSTATGNSTIFGKRFDPNGDTVITIVGAEYLGQIDIFLVNTNSSGTYIFENNPTSRQYALCHFSIGGGLGELYIATTGSQPGTITIDNLTSNLSKDHLRLIVLVQAELYKSQMEAFKGEF